MPSVLEPSWIGRRVSVRRVTQRGPDGSLRTADVVGDLLGLDAQTAVVDTRGGPVEVPVAHVVAARQAPTSTADELALEAVATRGVRPADTEELGGWLLRADHGFLRRANSVLPLRQLGLPLDEALARAHAWYAERGLPLVVATLPEARRLLDAGLGERGWEPVGESHVMAVRLDLVVTDPGAAADPRVELAASPGDEWFAGFRGGSDVPAAGRALLARHDTVAFARLAEGGRTLAIGRGVVDDGWLGVSCVEVAPDARRQGLAAAVMDALSRWALARDATRSYLQVEVDNAAAVALYGKLGYWVHHDYRYRLEPPPGFVPERPW